MMIDFLVQRIEQETGELENRRAELLRLSKILEQYEAEAADKMHPNHESAVLLYPTHKRAMERNWHEFRKAADRLSKAANELLSYAIDKYQLAGKPQ